MIERESAVKFLLVKKYKERKDADLDIFVSIHKEVDMLFKSIKNSLKRDIDENFPLKLPIGKFTTILLEKKDEENSKLIFATK